MRKNNNRLIGLTVLAVVIMHILAESNLLAAGWSRVLDTAASLLVVVAIAYIALGKHANVSILSGSRRELAGRYQDLPRPRGWSGSDRCQLHQYHGWR